MTTATVTPIAPAPQSDARPCETKECSNLITGPYRRKCNACIAKIRRRRARWIPTPQIDDKLREIYTKRLTTKMSFTLQQYANNLGWPRHALCNRARQLGLARTKEKPWSATELELLEGNRWKSDGRISNIFYRHGFKRSPVAIHLKITRTGGRSQAVLDHAYTAHHLAGLFGLDSHQVVAWIKSGKLRASRRGTNRNERQGGDMWQIEHAAVFAFVKQNPLAFDLRKVDQLWFMDMVLQKGKELT